MRSLAQAVDATRAALERDPDSYMFAKFPPGAPVDAGETSTLPTGLRDLLELTDGFHAGELAFYPTGSIAQAQHYCEDLDGGAERWMCFGLNMDYPLFVERTTGAVWHYPDIQYEHHLMSDRFEILGDDVKAFFADYVLGEGYLRLTVSDESDPWFRFLRGQGLVS